MDRRYPLQKIRTSSVLLTSMKKMGRAVQLSPISIREQRIARAREVLGLKQQHDRGDRADHGAARVYRATDGAKALQLLNSQDGRVLRKALQRLHVKWYHCETERLQSLLRAAGAPAKASNLVPQVVQACQACREWKRPWNANNLTHPWRKHSTRRCNSIFYSTGRFSSRR